MLFKEQIGQKELGRSIRQMVQDDHLPHALLLLGPEGCGKLALALALSQYLLCEQPDATDACGQCSACLKVQKLIHPDMHFAFPVVGSKAVSDHFLTNWRPALLENPYLNAHQWLQLIGAENKQGNISKEECVSIVKKLSLKTFEGRRKIMLIWRPEYLGKEGNRLLKIIEEPPEGTIFILVAEQSELILNTILSRCQLIKVNALPDEAIISGLQHNKNVDAEVAARAAHLANGNYNTALSLVGEGANNNATLFLDWLRKCYKGNGVQLVKWTEQFAQLGRENQKYFLQYALHFLREFMLYKATAQKDLRLQEEEKQTVFNLAKVLEIEQVEALAVFFSECMHHIERNANPKILLLEASIQVHRIMKNKTSSAVGVG